MTDHYLQEILQDIELYQDPYTELYDDETTILFVAK